MVARAEVGLLLLATMTDWVSLPRRFYEPSAAEVAPALLGHWLVRRTAAGLCGGPIVETEAYVQGDAACHAFPGPTPRNRVMFGPAGHAYVYLIYGCHFCVNAVCLPPGKAEAVLIRAVEPVLGVELMRRFRQAAKDQNLTNGPGKLCQALDIRRGLDGADLCDASGPLFVARNPQRKRFLAEGGPIITATRIGLTKAAHLELRFYLDASASVSVRRRLGSRS